jgi:outer membrane protein OmpA-like peptidoglycan-associated protein
MRALQILSLSVLLLAACSKTDKETATQEDEAVLKKDEEVSGTTKEKTNWDEVDITSPIVKYDEVKSTDVEVRGTDNYSVYSLDETVLFDVNQSTLKSGAEAKLQEIIASVKQRYPDGDIAVKGYTDNTGDRGDNKDLSKARAEAVADYLSKNGIPKDRIEVRGKGEKDPAATNDTEAGRAKNRRVEIIARS